MIAFHIPGENITVHDITGGNTQHLEDMLGVFKQLLPDYEFSIPTLIKNAKRPANFNPRLVEHQWYFEVDGKPAGMTVFKYVPPRDIGFGLYLGILPEFRKLVFGQYSRFSEMVIAATRVQMQIDALEMGRQLPVAYVAEVAEPRLVQRYQQYGFVELALDYHEPLLPGGRLTPVPLDKIEKTEFHRLQIGLFPIAHDHINPNDPTLLANAALALLVDHYNVPESHWSVRRALDSINANHQGKGDEHHG